MGNALDVVAVTRSVKTFGAVGDGVTDDTTALNAALAVGGRVFFPAGTYLISDELSGVSGTQVIAEGGALIDGSALGELDTILAFSGSVGSSLTLTANGTAGASTIALSAVTGLAAGDPLYISANTLLPAGTAGIYIGEWNTIKSISGLNVTLVRPLDGTYNTADSAYVKKITPVENILVDGLRVLGSGRNATNGVEGQIGIGVTYGRNVTVRNCQVTKTDYNAIRGDWVDTFVVVGNNIQHDDEGATNTDSVQYGVTFLGGSRNVYIAGNHIIGGKHGIAGSRNANNGVHYDITIEGNTVEGTWHAAITTHDNARRLTITGNKVIGCQRGIECRVQDMVVANNVIERLGSTLGEGIFLTEFPSRITITGNRIRYVTQGIKMYDSGLETSSVPLDVIIEGNSIKDVTTHAIYLEHTENSTNKTGWSVRNNVLPLLPATTYGIYMSGTFLGPVIQGNQISTADETTALQGVYVLGGQNMVIDGNTMDKTAGIRIATEPTTGDVPDACVITNNKCFNLKSGFFAVAIANGTNTVTKGNTGHPSQTLTIATGVISVRAYAHIVDTEGAAASDDLDTINGGANVREEPVVFRAASSARTVVFKDATGNLQLNGDFSLTHIDDTITLQWTGSTWAEVARSDNTA